MQNCDGEMRGGSETEEAYSFARLDSSDAQAAEADDAGAEQGSGVEVVQGVRKGIDEAGAGESVFGVASVDRIAGKRRSVAQIFKAFRAIGARSIDASQPGNPDSRANRQFPFHHLADDLMSRDQRTAQGREFAFGDVQVGAADSARANAQQHVARSNGRYSDFSDNEGLFRLFENGCQHHKNSQSRKLRCLRSRLRMSTG
jgi:hypothetical protein